VRRSTLPRTLPSEVHHEPARRRASRDAESQAQHYHPHDTERHTGEHSLRFSRDRESRAEQFPHDADVTAESVVRSEIKYDKVKSTNC